jgi:hypothetical protein
MLPANIRDQSTQDWAPSDPGSGQVNDFRPPFRWLLTERSMWTVAVVVSHVLGED